MIDRRCHSVIYDLLIAAAGYVDTSEVGQQQNISNIPSDLGMFTV